MACTYYIYRTGPAQGIDYAVDTLRPTPYALHGLDDI